MDQQAGKEQGRFAREIATKERRKLRARRRREHGLWYGLGMFGLVGWTVSIPTVIALALGIWIDSHYPSRFSWTLMLLALGIATGCLNAWYWVSRESRSDDGEGG